MATSYYKTIMHCLNWWNRDVNNHGAIKEWIDGSITIAKWSVYNGRYILCTSVPEPRVITWGSGEYHEERVLDYESREDTIEAIMRCIDGN